MEIFFGFMFMALLIGGAISLRVRDSKEARKQWEEEDDPDDEYNM